MKTSPPISASTQKARISVAGIVEWVILSVVLTAVLFTFLNFNGFIDTTDIHPYPF